LLALTAIIGPPLKRRIKEIGGIGNMATHAISVQRFSLISSKPFGELIAAIDAQIGHPDMKAFQKAVNAAQSTADLEKVVQGAVGPTGFMEFARFNLGEILRKDQGTKARPVLRMVIGNPLIMKEMVKLTPDAGAYAPITILIDDGSNRCKGHLRSSAIHSVDVGTFLQSAVSKVRDKNAGTH
jgi:uncharacterized protein (DUF302 family)